MASTKAGLPAVWTVESSHQPIVNRASSSSYGSDACEILTDSELAQPPLDASASADPSNALNEGSLTIATCSASSSANSSAVWYSAVESEPEPVVERRSSSTRQQTTPSPDSVTPDEAFPPPRMDSLLPEHLSPEEAQQARVCSSAVPLVPIPTQPPKTATAAKPRMIFPQKQRPPKPKAFPFNPKRLSTLLPLQLSPIPGSPAPNGGPSPPPLVRAHTSPPPMLPQVETTSDLRLMIQPPTATILPSSPTWPSLAALPLPDAASRAWSDLAMYKRPDVASSAPELSSGILAATPVLNGARFESSPESSPILGLSVSAVDLPSLNLAATADDAAAAAPAPSKLFWCLNELVETESGYLNSLRVLVKVYFATLPFIPTLSPAEVRAIVRTGESLLALHEQMVARLEQLERSLEWQSLGARGLVDQDSLRHAAGEVADIFLDEMDRFELYDDFCARHGEALDIVRSLERKPEWEAYERQCGSRAATTPAAALGDLNASPFFINPSRFDSPTISPLATTNSGASNSTAALDTPTSSSTGSSATLPRSKLRFHDFAITPIQRICRYPMLCQQVLKQIGECDERAQVTHALEGFKRIAERVDASKRKREGELRTKLVASRMDFNSSANSALCDLLGETLLVGTLHFLHKTALTQQASAESPPRIKYYGALLFASHVVVVKVRKREIYEPREWLPLRLLDISSIAEGEGLLPFSIKLSHGQHSFELGSTCASEKSIWLDALLSTQAAAKAKWRKQPRNAKGEPTLFDDTLVSSIPADTSSNTTHRRTTSQASIVPASPLMTNSPALPFPAEMAGRGQRLASSLMVLARTPAAQRAAIDLRLADVFSDVLLAARAAAAREASSLRPGTRVRTTSTPKRANTGSIGRMSAKERRRQSMADIPTMAALEDGFRGPVGFDVGQGEVYRENPAMHKWTNSIRKNKSVPPSPKAGRERPQLHDIDIDAALSAKASWKSRTAGALRSATSHSTNNSPVPQQAAQLVTVESPVSSSQADVERNNSVSSTMTSSSTGGSASTGGTHLSSPASSVPPSPMRSIPLELHPSQPTPRWADSVSHALKLNRRRSTLGLPFGWGSPEKDDALEQLTSNPNSPTTAQPPLGPAVEATPVANPGSSMKRRDSTGFFSKRVQSSPGLSSIFGASPHSKSTTSLRLTDSPETSPPDTPGSERPLSRQSSRSNFGSALGLNLGSSSAGSSNTSLGRRGSTGPTRKNSLRAMFGFGNGMTPLSS